MIKQELPAIVDTLKEFRRMLSGQQLMFYTDHKNLMQDALGLTSDQLLLEEYARPPLCKSRESTTQLWMQFHDWTMDPSPVPDRRASWMTFPNVRVTIT
jgi:hypothetical protein